MIPVVQTPNVAAGAGGPGATMLPASGPTPADGFAALLGAAPPETSPMLPGLRLPAAGSVTIPAGQMLDPAAEEAPSPSPSNTAPGVAEPLAAEAVSSVPATPLAVPGPEAAAGRPAGPAVAAPLPRANTDRSETPAQSATVSDTGGALPPHPPQRPDGPPAEPAQSAPADAAAPPPAPPAQLPTPTRQAPPAGQVAAGMTAATPAPAVPAAPPAARPASAGETRSPSPAPPRTASLPASLPAATMAPNPNPMSLPAAEGPDTAPPPPAAVFDGSNGRPQPQASPAPPAAPAPAIAAMTLDTASGPARLQLAAADGSKPTGPAGGVGAGADGAILLRAPLAAAPLGPQAALNVPPPALPVAAIAVHIAAQALNGAKRFDIRLDPPELGRIEIRLDVTREGQVATHLAVERAETLDLLQRDARTLERALQQAGLDAKPDGLTFSLKDQGQAHQQARDGQTRPEAAQTEPEADEAPDEPASHTTSYIAGGGVDIRI